MSERNITQYRNIIKRTNKLQSWLFETMNKIDKPLMRLIKKIKKKGTNNQHYEWKSGYYYRHCKYWQYNRIYKKPICLKIKAKCKNNNNNKK